MQFKIDFSIILLTRLYRNERTFAASGNDCEACDLFLLKTGIRFSQRFGINLLKMNVLWRKHLPVL